MNSIVALHRFSLPIFTTNLSSSSPRISRFRFVTTTASSARQNPNRRTQIDKNLIKARESIKDFSSLSPISTQEDHPSLSPNQAFGMVASAQANFMRVVVESASEALEDDENPRIGVELLCVVKAVLKKIKRRVLVGDKVLVGGVDWVDKRGMIENVFKRKSEILDPPVANVDHLLVLFSVEQPKLDPYALTRFLIEAESTGIPVTLALNKVELVDEQTQLEWKTRLGDWGYEPIFCSVTTGCGLDSLAFILREQTTVIVGPSGVGKSSLINALRSNQPVSNTTEMDNLSSQAGGSKWLEDQRVGEVSIKSGRGKHTTRHVSLLPISNGGYFADTPGFSQPTLMKATTRSLALMFPEVRKMLADSEPTTCSFNNCMHLGEPGCVVRGDWERFPYYLQLLDEIKVREEFQLRTVGTKREADVRYKVGDNGVKQAEPRLEFKKHRRQSRKRVNQSILDEMHKEMGDDQGGKAIFIRRVAHRNGR